MLFIISPFAKIYSVLSYVLYSKSISLVFIELSSEYYCIFLFILNPSHSLQTIIFPLSIVTQFVYSLFAIATRNAIFPLPAIYNIIFKIIHYSISMRLFIFQFPFILPFWKTHYLLTIFQFFLTFFKPGLIIFSKFFFSFCESSKLVLNSRFDLIISDTPSTLVEIFFIAENSISQGNVGDQIFAFYRQICFWISVLSFKPFLYFFPLEGVSSFDHDWIFHDFQAQRANILFRDLLFLMHFQFNLMNYNYKHSSNNKVVLMHSVLKSYIFLKKFFPFLLLLNFSILKQRKLQNIYHYILLKQMFFSKTLLIILLVFHINGYEVCQGPNKHDLIQSGVIQFVNSEHSKTSCVSIQINYHVPKLGFSVAVSAQSFDYQPSSGLDYSVRISEKKYNSLALSLIVEDDYWNKFSVFYFITSRSDIFVGNFIVDVYSLLGCFSPENSVATIKHKDHSCQELSGSLSVQIFISGIKTDKKQISLNIIDSKINSTSGVLQFKIKSDSSPPVQNLHISYIIWANVQFRLFTSVEISNQKADNQIIGIIGFTQNQPSYLGLFIDYERLKCIGHHCKSTCVSYDECKKCTGNIVQDICYICKSDEKFEEGKCVSICGQKEIQKDGKCICKESFERVESECRPICGQNQIWLDGFCGPKFYYAKNNGIQILCPPESQISQNGNECECKKKNYHWNPKQNTCDYLDCNEYEHVQYKKNKFECACNLGYHSQNGKCQGYISCPPRSIWNQKKLQCICTVEGEYLIGKQCKACDQYEGWNGSKCVCRTGYYKINGTCRTCDPHSYFNGRDCICNHGYFGNADKCEKCHESCGKCSGQGANECLACSDVSYNLVDGYCKRDIPCPTGLYLDGKQCKPCSFYCADCESESVCNTCIDGFRRQKLEMYGVKASYCSQICGDGKRFELDCDDGNQKNGDGCSEECEVEKGYICQGGSSINPSTCVSHKISNTYVIMKGSVHMFGKIVQGIRLSYIPKNLTDNECSECSKLLLVKVIQSELVPAVVIKYLPNTKYQFLAEFEFHGIFAIPVFSISVQINPNYAKYFSDADMAQIKIKRIDPSVLAKVDDDNALDFGEISQQITHKIFD